MSNPLWLRAYVEQLLCEIWDNPSLVVDGDGDWPFRSDFGACWVQVETTMTPWQVNVFGHAVHGVKRSAKLLTELNEVTGNARAVKAFWVSGLVIVRSSVLADDLGERSLRYALDGVTSIIDDIAPMIAAAYDGQTPFTPEPVDHDH